MHQHPRTSPASVPPGKSPRTNNQRSNTGREQDSGASRTSSDRGTPSDQGIGIGEGADAISRGQEALGKLTQVVQCFFTKAALTILHNRVSLPPAYTRDSRTRRVNKWFNVEFDETELLRDDVQLWRLCDLHDSRPPSMIIEVFIDVQDLSNNQNLVILDEQGRRWDVEEALNRSPTSSAGGNSQLPRPEVVIERWVVHLGDSPEDLPQDLGTYLPRTYKHIVVLFRSLVTQARMLPAGKFGKRLYKERSSVKSPKLKYRIAPGPHDSQSTKLDQLSTPLIGDRNDVVQSFAFGPVDSPAGDLSIDVSYRVNCDFRIDDSEAFLSSRFMGMDEDYFEPSLGPKSGNTQQGRVVPVRGASEVGSLPPNRKNELVVSQPEQGQAYGSLSTFHQTGLGTGTSPLSALRAARVVGSESPEDVMPKKAPPSTRSTQGSRSSLRSAEGGPGMGRRPSVSFMPFKSPSLSASPSPAEQIMTSAPRSSLGRASPLAALAEARAPSTLSPSGSVASKGSPNPTEQALYPAVSGSPKPAPPTRYSSSFGHRRSRLSTGGSSRTEDDNSSGKASITSSNNQPGSGVLAEGGGASSGSIQTDDDNISDFLKMLDQKRELRSFRTPDDQASAEASTRRTSAALSKFQRMKDSNDALSNSLYSSLHLHRSSTSSSRQLSSVPPMVAGTSISTSSSPGKPISPHTPHTPTIPSRLSANSTIDYTQQVPTRESARHGRLSAPQDDRDQGLARNSNTGAIDIPNSPRPFHPSYHRSSSAAQRPSTMPYGDDELFPFGMRSASLGVDDRPPLSLSALAGLHENEGNDESAVEDLSAENRRSTLEPDFNPNAANAVPMARDRSSSTERREEASSLPMRGVYRPRIGRGSGRGNTPPQSSSLSLASRGSGSTSSDQRGGRYSFTRPASNFEDEEPLLFAMSDFDATQQPRRSLEESRGGLSAGSQDRGGGDSGYSSKRGSRRGGY